MLRLYFVCVSCLVLIVTTPVFCAESQFEPVLTSHSISPEVAAPGSSLRCRFTFMNRGKSPATSEEKIFLHFESEKSCAAIKWQHDHDPPYATTFWMPGMEMIDGPFHLTIPQEIAEGEYYVHAGIWNPVTDTRSLDVYLPEEITVSKDASKPEPLVFEPLSSEEEARRVVKLLRRFHQEPLVRLENDMVQFRVQTERGLYLIKNTDTGNIWQSPPNAAGIGMVSAVKEEKRIRVPLDSLTVVKQGRSHCLLAKKYKGSTVLTLCVRIDSKEPSLLFSWASGEEWQVKQIEFNSLLWTTETQGGGAVVPRLLGQYFPADNGIESRKVYGTYHGWGGLHIPMSGVVRKEGAALLSWDDPYISLQYRSRIGFDARWPGSQVISFDILSGKQEASFRLDLVDGDSYVDVAKKYRLRAKEKGNLVTLEKKIKRCREAEKLVGAALFKPFVCVRRNRTNAEGEEIEVVHTNYTEKDCIALIQHLHDELELEKVLFVLAGWIRKGYDNQHPDILPPAPEIGGDEGLHRISKTVRSCDYLFGLHDNYQDMYEDSPSWDESKIMMRPNGERMKGGVWAGGQAWLIASPYGLEFAKRNLPEIKRLYQPNAYFIDTTFAAPLYESCDPVAPLTYHDDLTYKQELSRYAAGLFGIHGSETGTEFGVPVSHYFEGILSGKPLIENFPQPGAFKIPLFPLVFHDCVAMFTHQGDRAGLGDAKKILKHLVYGTMPLYRIEPHRYWENEIPEPDFSDPNYCFAKGTNGWGEHKHVRDRFIKNTYEFLSPFAEGVAELPMTDHKYLKEDLSVECSEFGELWMVIVNYGPDDYAFGRTLLPPMGFVAAGPDFLAQHYYPDIDKDSTCLVVKNGGKTYYGYR